MLILLQLVTAHLIADFVLQSDWIARNKQRAKPLFAHSAIHFLCSCVLVNLGLSWKVLAAIFILTITHALIDLAKARLLADGWIAFVLDQFAHLVVIGSVALVLGPIGWPAVRDAAVTMLRSGRIYLILAAYIGIIFGGGFLVQKISQFFLQTIEASLKDFKPGLPKAGLYIGWVERFLVLTFIVAGFEEGVGFLLGVKALARFPEIKEDQKGHFAEYFLVGTLTSVGLAFIGGFVVKAILPHV